MSEIRANAITDAAGTGAPDFPNGLTSAAGGSLNSPALTGTPTAPTATLGTNTTQIATTAFVIANAGSLDSPAFTGTPTAPTASVGTNTTQLATTAFVNAEIANDAPTKTGGGASGTWGINVTGSAGSVAWGSVTSKPSNIMYYQSFTLDANTMDSNSTGFTYSVNAPYTGPVARFSTGGGYDLWLNATYGGGNDLAFRTRNGDTNTLNPWRAIIHNGNYGSFIGGMATGDVGTYAWIGRPSTGTFVAGTTYAGSGLRYAGTLSATVFSDNTAADVNGATPAGTWRAMGSALQVANRIATTIFLRIA
jgi:hypothetical protein